LPLELPTLGRKVLHPEERNAQFASGEVDAGAGKRSGAEEGLCGGTGDLIVLAAGNLDDGVEVAFEASAPLIAGHSGGPAGGGRTTSDSPPQERAAAAVARAARHTGGAIRWPDIVPSCPWGGRGDSGRW
jgi:hypothetical protein